MKYTITINTEKDKGIVTGIVNGLFGKDFVSIEPVNETRTGRQNRSLHKFCTLQSDELRNNGIPLYTVLTHRPEMIWTMEAVKGVWRDIQKAEFGTTSTTELKKVGQIETIHKVITKLIAEATEGHASTPPFPSDEFYR